MLCYLNLSDEILLEFKTNISEDQQPQLNREINSFMAKEVCPGQAEVDYPQVDVARFVPNMCLLFSIWLSVAF